MSFLGLVGYRYAYEISLFSEQIGAIGSKRDPEVEPAEWRVALERGLSALLGLYSLFRGLGLESTIDATADRARNVLYAGRVMLITHVVALALLVVGGVQGYETLEIVRSAVGDGGPITVGTALAAFVQGFVQWAAVAGITSSLGQITDEYLAGEFRWRYLNAPFYVVAIAVVLYVVSGFFLPATVDGVRSFTLTGMAIGLTAGTLLGVFSTLAFAIAESRFPTAAEAETEADAEAT